MTTQEFNALTDTNERLSESNKSYDHFGKNHQPDQDNEINFDFYSMDSSSIVDENGLNKNEVRKYIYKPTFNANICHIYIFL